MEKLTTFKKQLLSSVILGSLFVSTQVAANMQQEEPAKTQESQQEQSETKSVDKSKSFVVDSEQSNDDELQTIEQWRAKRDKSVERGEDKGKQIDKSFRFKKRDRDCWSFGRCNQRDGFHYAFSMMNSSGDDYYSASTDSNEFNMYASYRVQIAGLFFESPGMSTRRLHGLYSDRSWGLNFYNTDQWRLDLYKNRDTKGVKGLEGIKIRNQYKRAGLRLTGFFDSSQLQMDWSPYSTSDQENDGVTGSMSYSYYWQVKNWNFYGTAGVQYLSKEVLSYGEIAPSSFDEREDRLNRDVEFGFEYPLNEHWVIGGFAAYNETDQVISSMTVTDANDITGFRSGLSISFIL